MKKSPVNKVPILSIIVLNYNAGKYLSDCLQSIYASDLTDLIEIIVVDNASTDGSISAAKLIKSSNPQILKTDFLILDTNIGFAAGNNRGLAVTNPQSAYVLFLNPDTTAETNTIQGMIDYFKNNQGIDAATCYITLALTGQLQPECHRGFPTPLNTFWHFFGFGLPRRFPHSRFFNGYFMGHLDYTKPQIIDCCVGAFFMLKRLVGDTVGWWNEKYFFYGEDLDFCYKLKQHGFKLYFVPDYKITHYQGISSGIKKSRSMASRSTRIRSAAESTKAMKIFYRENLINNYPGPLRWIVWQGINLLTIYRLFKARYL